MVESDLSEFNSGYAETVLDKAIVNENPKPPIQDVMDHAHK